MLDKVSLSEIARMAVVIAIAATASAHGQAGPTYRGLLSEAMGGTGVASAERQAALFSNPARLSSDDKWFSGGLSGTLGLNAVLLDYAQWAAENYQYLSDIDSLPARIEGIDNKWAPFSQYFSMAGQHRDIAVAVVWDLSYQLTVAQSALTPVLGVGAKSDLEFIAGRGISLENGYDIGLSLKVLHRTYYEEKLVGTLDEDFFIVKSRLERKADGFMDNLAKIQAASEVAETQLGLGLNMGVTRQMDPNWRVGMAFIDFPTVIASSFARPEINAGVNYTRELQFHPEVTNRLSVNTELHHLLAPDVPWFKQFKVGAAMEAYAGARALGYFALGVNDGYPTFGVRAGYIAYLGYTYFAQETGTQPGQRRLSFHKLTFDMEI